MDFGFLNNNIKYNYSVWKQRADGTWYQENIWDHYQPEHYWYTPWFDPNTLPYVKPSPLPPVDKEKDQIDIGGTLGEMLKNMKRSAEDVELERLEKRKQELKDKLEEQERLRKFIAKREELEKEIKELERKLGIEGEINRADLYKGKPTETEKNPNRKTI